MLAEMIRCARKQNDNKPHSMTRGSQGVPPLSLLGNQPIEYESRLLRVPFQIGEEALGGAQAEKLLTTQPAPQYFQIVVAFGQLIQRTVMDYAQATFHQAQKVVARPQ